MSYTRGRRLDSVNDGKSGKEIPAMCKKKSDEQWIERDHCYNWFHASLCCLRVSLQCYSVNEERSLLLLILRYSCT